MTYQHRATPEQWDFVERWASEADCRPVESCLLELRDRVEALEAAQRPSPSPAVERVLDMQERIQEGKLTLSEALQEIGMPAPDAPLVERVLAAMVFRSGAVIGDAFAAGKPEARAAIREAAAWLRSVGNNWSANDLEREISR